MEVVAVIPTRYASTRLPAKALLKRTGKYLIQHVYEAVRTCNDLDRVIVAADDERIIDAVKSFGGEAVMTSIHHQTGTDRIAEAVRNIDCAKVINVQGDEPEIDRELISALVRRLDYADMATLATPFKNPADVLLPNRVKVVLDRHQNALYFSRSRLPSSGDALLHLGLYGYTKSFLQHFVTLDRQPLEKAENLEQLRALEYGYKIKVGVVSVEPVGGIDTPADYEAFVKRYFLGFSS